MSLREAKRDQVREFILLNVRAHPADIVRIAQKKFGLSRPSVLRYMHELIDKDQLRADGSKRGTKYTLLPNRRMDKVYPIDDQIAEDKVWRNDVAPMLAGARKNVLDICQYGFTEIFNNAIEHSEGSLVTVTVVVWIDQFQILIMDNGVGIFNKIQKEYGLEDPLHAILELSKGKLTTEPAGHTGEGIFFTSRMFDLFAIVSGRLGFAYKDGIDLLTDIDEDVSGTSVQMEISPRSKTTVNKVFTDFAPDSGFDKTVVPVRLARYGNENLVSRSQARRLLARLDKFKNVMLDFHDVRHIGRAFADEIFRVFVAAHPGTHIEPFNHNKLIDRMIREIRSEARRQSRLPGL
jgi:anti-sigma regulatory factor (Ser/Thr protein kinase)